jgi:hypothetical protein
MGADFGLDSLAEPARADVVAVLRTLRLDAGDFTAE